MTLRNVIMFSCVYLPSIYPVWWNVYCDLFAISFLDCLLLRFKSYLYSLDTNFLSGMQLFKYFLHVCDLFFHSLKSVLHTTKILSFLMKYDLFFSNCGFGIISKSSIPNPGHIQIYVFSCFLKVVLGFKVKTTLNPDCHS